MGGFQNIYILNDFIKLNAYNFKIDLKSTDSWLKLERNWVNQLDNKHIVGLTMEEEEG